MARGKTVDKALAELVLDMKNRNPKLTTAQIGAVLEMDATTAGRILSTGSWEAFCAWKEEKARKGREKNRKTAEEKPAEEQQAEEQEVPGQMRMDLKPLELPEAPAMSDQTKMMRFLAGKFSEGNETLEKSLEHIAMNIDKLNDTLSMMLRVLRRE